MIAPTPPASALRIGATRPPLLVRAPSGVVDGPSAYWAIDLHTKLVYCLGLSAEDAAGRLPEAVAWYRSQGVRITAIALAQDTGPEIVTAAEALGLRICHPHLDSPDSLDRRLCDPEEEMDGP